MAPPQLWVVTSMVYLLETLFKAPRSVYFRPVHLHRFSKDIVGNTGDMASKFSIGPTQERGSHGEAGTNRGDENKVTFLQLPFFERGVHRKGNGPGGGIAVSIDIDDDFAFIHAYAIGSRVNDSKVGLVRDKTVDVVSGEPVSLQYGLA